MNAECGNQETGGNLARAETRMPAKNKIPRVCLVFAAIIVCAVLGGRGYSYFEGQAFYKSWFMPMIGLLVPLCFLGYLVTGFITLAVKFRWRWFLAILAAPLTWFGAYQVPLPDFTDGMRDALQKKVRPERLRLFAERVKLEPIPGGPNAVLDPSDMHRAGEPLRKMMKRDFPEIYALFRWEPTVVPTSDGVQISWGSALVQHWGIKIGSRPFSGADAEYLKGVSYREAFEGIWVYHDRY